MMLLFQLCATGCWLLARQNAAGYLLLAAGKTGMLLAIGGWRLANPKMLPDEYKWLNERQIFPVPNCQMIKIYFNPHPLPPT
ncbi:MAG: hypothetical protein Q8R96_15420 [Bacteroidota bacterium]|nr:hypothetical protein [Bacteroidota bacterium]